MSAGGLNYLFESDVFFYLHLRTDWIFFPILFFAHTNVINIDATKNWNDILHKTCVQLVPPFLRNGMSQVLILLCNVRFFKKRNPSTVHIEGFGVSMMQNSFIITPIFSFDTKFAQDNCVVWVLLFGHLGAKVYYD